MISTHKKFLFVHIPKTGGTTITLLFSPYSANKIKIFDSRIKGQRDISVYDDGGYNEIKHKSAMELMCNPWFPDYYKVAFVRNPWERAISYYFWTNGGVEFKEEEFKKCIENMKPQLEYITDPKGEIIVDFIGRYENFMEDIRKICDKLRLPAPNDLEHVNKGTHEHYSKYYTEETKEMIAQKFEKEIKYFDYKYELL